MNITSIILMVSIFALSLFLAVPVSVEAQAYLTENSTWGQNLTAVAGSSSTFGDINNDGNLDLALTGEDGYDNLIFKIYINNGSNLIENSTWQSNLTGIREGSIAFGDINNDGNLDLVAIGCDSGEVGQGCASYASKIYIHNGTTFLENSTWQSNFSTLGYRTLGIGDIDNDGDLDLAMSGGENDFSIYLNNGTVFIENHTWSQNIRSDLNDKTLYRGGIIFGDIDGDTDTDMIISGLAQISLTRIYTNNGTTLTRNTKWDGDLDSLQFSSLSFGDFDNDGFTDFVIMGRTPDSTIIYRNNGTTFIENQSQSTGTMAGMFDGGIVWGDYDNDGDLDLAQSGQSGENHIYINNNTIFEDVPEEENITDLDPHIGIVIWEDVDNDNDLDLLISGWVTTITKIYTNNITIPNTPPIPPSPPANNYTYENRKITLVWNNGSDTETGTTGLYYNLRVGTAANRNAIVTGVYGGSSNPTAGYFGNMMQRKNITLKVDRLQPSTTYYWSVQTIDTALANGSWSVEQSFLTPADMEWPVVTVNSPGDGYYAWNHTVTFNVTVSDNINLTNVSLRGTWNGGWHINETNSSEANSTDYIFTKDLSGDGDGTYTWSVQACDNSTNCYWTPNRTLTLYTPDIGLIENSTWQWNLSGSTYSNAAVLGDIDNDRDLDLISIGCDIGSTSTCSIADKSRIYINNGTSFVENSTWQQNLTGIGYGSIALGDIDNDGDLDMVLSQTSSSKLYTNNGTSFVENSTWQNTIINEEGGSQSILLGDIENDGDLDIIFSGMGGTLNNTFLYNGITFIGEPLWSQMTEEFKVSSFLGDFDNDGDLDISIMGLNSAKGYTNNGSGFVYNSKWNVFSGDEDSIVSGDMDNDGDMDAVQIGSGSKCNNVGNIFLNNGSQFITGNWSMALDQDMACFPFGSLAFGDYDNNGFLDLASIGGSDREIFSNNGTAFSKNATAEANITGEDYSSVLWGDVDNDGDLDLIIIRSQKVYINNNAISNTPPTPPSPPANNYSYNNREITLVWNNGSDAETGTTGLYYNLRVGTAANRNSIVSGVYGGYGDQTGGGTTGGYFGNMMQRKNLTLKVDRLMPSTTYYWSVQTIDTALANGSWSVEQSFLTPADMERPLVTINTPDDGYRSWNYTVSFNVTVSDNINLTNVSLWGTWNVGWHINETNSSGINGSEYIFSLDFTGDGDGTYVWSVQACDNGTNCYWTPNRTMTLYTPDIGLIENETWQSNLSKLIYSAIILGDIDNDGDMDLALTGENQSYSSPLVFAKMYENIGNSYMENKIWEDNITNSGVEYGALAFGDVDNDGDLDFILSGVNDTVITKIFIYNGTSFVENRTWQQNMTSARGASLALGDIDNDGDLDLVIVGISTEGSYDYTDLIAKVYVNNGTSLIENNTWQQNIKRVSLGSLAFSDIDNDNDLDLVLTGFTAIGYPDIVAVVYVNNGSTFIENNYWQQNLQGVRGSSVNWGDIDKDDNLDLILSGWDVTKYGRIYINNGTCLINNDTWKGDIANTEYTDVAWGDINNNGFLDLILNGIDGNNKKITNILTNNGYNFTQNRTFEQNITIIWGSLAFGDIDNDYDLDLILIGQNTSADGGERAKIYTNNITTPNTPPTPPSPPANNYSYSNREITLVWNNGSDAETGTTGLYYNLRVGTAANRNAIVTGVYGGSSNPTAGYFGNMMQRKNITLKVDRLQPSTTYYWSVQTIDTALANGSWSVEQSFLTPADIEWPVVGVNSPAGGYYSPDYDVTFNVTVSDNLNVSNVSLYGNWSGGWHLNSTNSSGLNGTDYVFSVDFGGDGDGWYLWEAVVCDNSTNCQSTGNLTLAVDTAVPGVGFEASTPANDSNVSATSVTIYVSFLDANPDTMVLNWNGTNTSYAYSGNSTAIPKSGLADGPYTYYAWANDSAGWSNVTETRVLTIDTVPISNVSFVWPTPDDGSVQAENYTYINVSLSEEPEACLLEWDDGTPANVTMNRSGSNCYLNMTGLISYVYGFTVHANDSADNWNNTGARTVTVDTGDPIVILASPGHDSWDADGAVTFVYNASDTLLDSCSLYGNWSGGWHLNETNSSPANGSYSSFSGSLGDGNYAWNVVCNDTSSNSGSSPSNLTVNIDMTYPVAVIASPINMTYNASPSLDFSYAEANPYSCWYDLNGAGNTSLASCGTNGTLLSSVEGTNVVVLYINDSAGNINSSTAYWTLDTTPPQITADSPGNRSYSSYWLWANVTLDEAGSWCGYSLNGSANVTMGNDSQVHFYANITALSEATSYLAYSCNDSVSNMNATNISMALYFTVDWTAPVLSNAGNGTVAWNAVTIGWDTDESCNSSVLYGTDNASLSSNASNASFDSSHNITLSGLSGGTAYYYNVSSCDSAGNCNASGTYSFTTPPCVEAWTYGSWSGCTGGIQTRTATDSNGCGTTASRDVVSRSCSSGSGGSGGTVLPGTGASSYVWDEIVPEQAAVLSINRPDISLTRIDFRVSVALANVNIAVEDLAARPDDVEASPEGPVYQYLSINHDPRLNDTVLESATIMFDVNRSWISGNGIDKTAIRLQRYAGGGWEALETRLVNESVLFASYEARSPGLSYFAVTGDALQAPGNACNSNRICEPGLGEDATGCPGDCASNGGQQGDNGTSGNGDAGGRAPGTGSDTAWLLAVSGVIAAAVLVAFALHYRSRHGKR